MNQKISPLFQCRMVQQDCSDIVGSQFVDSDDDEDNVNTVESIEDTTANTSGGPYSGFPLAYVMRKKDKVDKKSEMQRKQEAEGNLEPAPATYLSTASFSLNHSSSPSSSSSSSSSGKKSGNSTVKKKVVIVLSKKVVIQVHIIGKVLIKIVLVVRRQVQVEPINKDLMVYLMTNWVISSWKQYRCDDYE